MPAQLKWTLGDSNPRPSGYEPDAHKLASEFVNSLDYNKYYPEVKRSFLQLEDAKQRYLA